MSFDCKSVSEHSECEYKYKCVVHTICRQRQECTAVGVCILRIWNPLSKQTLLSECISVIIVCLGKCFCELLNTFLYTVGSTYSYTNAAIISEATVFLRNLFTQFTCVLSDIYLHKINRF